MSRAALTLDLLPRRLPRGRVFGWAALGVALLVAAALLARESALSDELDALQARNDRLQERLHPQRAAVRAAAPDALQARRIEHANAVIEALTVPWDTLFRSVESADNGHLGLLTLLPNAADHSLRLSGEAASVPDLLDYVDRLAAGKVLSRVHLVSYETVARDGSEVIAFTLAAQWMQR